VGPQGLQGRPPTQTFEHWGGGQRHRNRTWSAAALEVGLPALGQCCQRGTTFPGFASTQRWELVFRKPTKGGLESRDKHDTQARTNLFASRTSIRLLNPLMSPSHENSSMARSRGAVDRVPQGFFPASNTQRNFSCLPSH